MPRTTASRRALQFNDLDAVAREAESLLARGYRKAGAWDLAQVCGHLTEWMRYPLDGFPAPPLFPRLILAALRRTIAPGQLRRILKTGSMPVGAPTMPTTVPDAGGDEADAVARLREVVERFKAYQGTPRPSPLFGPLDLETATRLQLIHCAHHFGFLVPNSQGG